jgi:hypothetical protein
MRLHFLYFGFGLKIDWVRAINRGKNAKVYAETLSWLTFLVGKKFDNVKLH